MYSAIDGEVLLALWERALVHAPDERGVALLQATFGDFPNTSSLGTCNLRLAELHARLFGRELALTSHCPSCDSLAQFSGDCAALVATATAQVPAVLPPLRVGDFLLEFRLPTAVDIKAAAHYADAEQFARHLLERCVLACTRNDETMTASQLPLVVLDALSRHLEVIDPAASVSFAVTCPQCKVEWDARLDLAEVLWRKLQVTAERFLLDIDILARTYGWTEGEVMSLSATRRAAYVQMAMA